MVYRAKSDPTIHSQLQDTMWIFHTDIQGTVGVTKENTTKLLIRDGASRIGSPYQLHSKKMLRQSIILATMKRAVMPKQYCCPRCSCLDVSLSWDGLWAKWMGCARHQCLRFFPLKECSDLEPKLDTCWWTACCWILGMRIQQPLSN